MPRENAKRFRAMAERDDKAKAGGDEPRPSGPAVGSPVPSHLPVQWIY